LISLYVDDLIIVQETQKKLISIIKKQMSHIFEMKDLGELHYCLGLKVWRNVGQTFVSQGKYVREVLKKFKMDQCKVSYAPMQQNMKLYCDDGSKEVNSTVYRHMVGCLNYLTTTRPDIAYFVSVLSRFMEKPLENHWNAVKGVLRYLKGTIDYGIKYIDSFDVELIFYSYSD
jgi:protein associated with RNAse G/E